MRAYSNPSRAMETYALPDVEIFEVKRGEWYLDSNGERTDEQKTDDGETTEPCEAGWYYWYCLPGCMPDSEPNGPFATAREAFRAMRDDANSDGYPRGTDAETYAGEEDI